MSGNLMGIGVPIIGVLYMVIGSYSIPIKLLIFIISLVFSVFIPADGDMTLMFCEKYGKSVDNLKGKVVWITGASTGLGAALAVTLAKHGVKLALSARSVENLEKIKEKCIESGATKEDVLVLPLDMLRYDQHQSACDSVVAHFKKIDVLVSNAGRSQRAQWESIEISVDKELFDLNVFSLISLARIVTKHFMSVGGGHHVVTSSTAGKVGPPLSASYSASKHALHGYFETLRMEKSGSGLDVTMLCPGPFHSNIMAGCFTDTIGKKVDTERTGKIMSGERCADLSAVAIANKLSEVWIAENPILSFYYAIQYFPSLVKYLFSMVGVKGIMKLRDGHNKAVKE